jgi:DNA-binding MurR/RpiR family transcriptional regulator
MTAARLGTEVGVSESTVVRFVMELGFEGYPEFRRALLELIRSKLTAVQRIEVTNTLIGDADVLEAALLLLTENNVNVEYIYAFVEKKTSKALVVLRTENNELSLKLLKDNGFSIIEDEAYTI